jgi:hypothetical protein
MSEETKKAADEADEEAPYIWILDFAESNTQERGLADTLDHIECWAREDMDDAFLDLPAIDTPLDEGKLLEQAAALGGGVKELVNIRIVARVRWVRNALQNGNPLAIVYAMGLGALFMELSMLPLVARGVSFEGGAVKEQGRPRGAACLTISFESFTPRR